MKKGQASGAAILLAVIAGLIIMFIVLIPPSERQDLLGDDSSSDDDDGSNDVSAKILLQESPGRLDYLDNKQVEHPLPVITVYTKEESKVIGEKNLARVSKRIFSEQESDFPLIIENWDNVENVLLSFTIGERSEGSIIVTLNGEEIYNFPASTGAIQPIKVPKASLQKNNLFTFSVSSPGFAFWKTNEVLIKNIEVIGDVTNLEAQRSKNVFLVTETEKNNLERVLLQFQPGCNIADVGKLKIEINGNSVYDAVPDCDVSMIPVEFSPLQLVQGENEISFSTDKGIYQLSHVVIKSQLEEVDFTTYYFDLSFEQYQSIKNNKFNVIAELNFVDVTAKKKGEIIFNGHTRHFDTDEIDDEIDLSKDVVQGTNALKIKPTKTLEIRELKVSLE